VATTVTLQDLDCKKRKDFVVSPRLVAHVLQEWKKVSRTDLAQGIEWYEGAGEIAHTLAAGSHYSPDQIGAVIAAMSPRMPWGRNKLATRKIVDRHSTGNGDFTGIGLWDNVKLSYAILDDASNIDVLVNKRLNFFRNIMGEKHLATVDSWMCKILFGRETDIVSAGDNHDLCSMVIESAAQVAGLNPRDFQAALWVMVRREMLTESELANYENEDED
jgi:hypothetical protein